ncbi:MAG: metallophosphoesterase [Bacillota bacterium]|nr:metallophosphoesterase [Bacillota bacterium]
MKRRLLSLTVTLAVLAAPLVSTGTNVSAAALTYNETAIDSNLNATTTPDHIVLNWTGDPTTTQTITWRTSTIVTSGQVQYRLKGDTNFTIYNVPASNIKTYAAASTDTPGSMEVFSAALTGLQPGKTYEYKVGDGTNFSTINTFTTEVSNNTRTKFLVFGDSQSGNAANLTYAPWHDTIQEAFSQNSDANFVVNLGDLVEAGQNYQHWNNWFNAAAGVIDHIPEMPVQGNHETYDKNYTSTAPYTFVDQFSVPQNGTFGHIGQTYSYDYGNVHFVVLDSQEDEEAPGNDSFLQQQADWLDKDLSANKQKWTIVMFHKTPYYNKKTRNNPAVKDIFTPVIEKHHVDVVFNGHDHGLSRTFAINGDKYYTDYSKGTVYYVTGRSGNKYYTDLGNKVWDASFIDAQDSPTYEVAEVVNGKLTIKAYKYSTTNSSYSTPTLVDILVIDKDNPANSTPMTLSKSDKTQLAVAGSIVPSYNPEVVNNKAYVDPSKIASWYGGTYDAATFTLTVNKKNYVFTAGDLLNNDPTKVNLDALYNAGIDCKYNADLNCVLVEFTGRVNTAAFKGFTIGELPTATPAETTTPTATATVASTQTLSAATLPKTGSTVDYDIALVIGFIAIGGGLYIITRKNIG